MKLKKELKIEIKVLNSKENILDDFTSAESKSLLQRPRNRCLGHFLSHWKHECEFYIFATCESDVRMFSDFFSPVVAALTVSRVTVQG